MKLIETKLKDVVIIQPKVFEDERGFFMETFRHNWLNETFVQDNHSKSKKGVLRGLHFQTKKPQGKLVRVVQGHIFDVAVDIKPQSPTYKQWVGIELSSANKTQLYIPAGYAHGFFVLSDWAEIIYKCTNYYDPNFEKCLLWNDSSININWNLQGITPILSDKDSQGKTINAL